MGKAESILGAVSGKVGPAIFYNLRGTEKMIIKSRPVRSKHARKTHERFEKTRQQNKEFAGCVEAASRIWNNITSIKLLADHNCFGHMQAVCKLIQQADTTSPVGERPVLISKSRSLLNGFSFNMYHPFGSLVRVPVECSIDRATVT